jgi:TonB family protein
MGRMRVSLVRAGVLLLGMAGMAFSQAQSGIDTVDKWDVTIDSVRAMATAVHSATDKRSKDIRGRTAEEDWKQWILTPETEARLDSLREKVRAQATLSDYNGVTQTMKEAVPLVEAEAYKSRVLSTYWLVQGALVHHRQLLEPLMARAPRDQAKIIADRMKGREQTLADAIAPAVLSDPATAGVDAILKMRKLRAEAVEDYNRQRADLVEHLAGKSKTPPKSRARHAPCPQPSTATSGSDKPRLAPSDVSLDEVYPPSAQRDEVEGRVVVRVSISATGCMERAEVATSSGAEELDEAALLWAERGSFLPAEKDGKPVSGSFAFAVHFKLPD